MKSVGIFADISNLYYSVSRKYIGRKLDYQKYLTAAVNDYHLYRAFAYISQESEEAQPFITCLRHFKYETRCKKLKKFEWDMSIAVDVIRILDRLDIVVLGSTSINLLPLIEYIQDRGKQVLIFACNIPRELKDHTDFYHEIIGEHLENDSVEYSTE